jgi:hypothetical protein
MTVFFDLQPPWSRRRQRAAPFEQAADINLGHFGATIRQQQGDPTSGRAEYPQGPAFRGGMHAEDSEWVVVTGAEKTFERLGHSGLL